MIFLRLYSCQWRLISDAALWRAGICVYDGLLNAEDSSAIRESTCSRLIRSISRIYLAPEVSSIELRFRVNVSSISSSCRRSESSLDVSSLIFSESLIRLLFITRVMNGSMSCLGWYSEIVLLRIRSRDLLAGGFIRLSRSSG